MKERRIISYRIMRIFIFILIGILLYNYLSKVLERKDSQIKNGEFIEEEKNYDVLIFGNSHAYNAIYPMELWNQYGIFSYNLAGPNNEMAVTYWEIVNALDYSVPELIVLDCASIRKEVKVPGKYINNIHKTWDMFPISINKIKGIIDLMGINEGIGFLWPFSKYHSRWNDLGEEEFNWTYAIDKGAKCIIGVAVPRERVYLDRTEKLTEETIGVIYFHKILELCKEREIDILLTYLPFPANADQVREANLVYDIAAEYGVNYINFLDMEGFVDFNTDCRDKHSHMNPSGARKITEYLGAYMQENYGIEDRRIDPTYESWNEDYEKYTKYKFEIIQEQQSLDIALMLHYDKNISTCIYVKEGSDILQDERMVKLIKNVSPYVEPVQLETAIQNGSEYFLVVDNGWCDIWESVGGEPLTELGTTFGSLSFEGGDGKGNLRIQDMQENRLVEGTDVLPDVQIITINRLTGEIVNRAAYSVDGNDEHGNIVAVKSN